MNLISESALCPSNIEVTVKAREARRRHTLEAGCEYEVPVRRQH